MTKLKTQIGDSLTSDFKDNTWTFEMPDNFNISAGEFAIIPKEKYDRLIVAMKGIVRSVSIHPDNTEDSEFEAMINRCNEALDNVE